MHQDRIAYHRITVDQYYRMAEVGVLSPDERAAQVRFVRRGHIALDARNPDAHGAPGRRGRSEWNPAGMRIARTAPGTNGTAVESGGAVGR